LVKSFDWKRFLAVYSQVPVGKQIFLMNFDLCFVGLPMSNPKRRRYAMKVAYAAKIWMDYHRSHSKKTPYDPKNR